MRPGQYTDPVTGVTRRFTDETAEAGKKAIHWEAKRAYGLQRPATGPVVLRVVAIYAIPASWPQKLKDAALAGRVMHVSDPDLDQLQKQVMDALKGVAFVDDNQVCGFPNSAKRYGTPERTEITVEVLPQEDHEKTPGQRRLEKRVVQEGWDAVLAPPPPKSKRSNADSFSGGTSAKSARSGPGGRRSSFRAYKPGPGQ